jgi:hypothetical protein
MILKKIGRRVRMAENLLNGPRPRDRRFRVLSVRRPNSAKDDGDALIFFRPDQDQAQRSNRLPGDFSRRLIGSAVLRSRRDNA